MLQIVLPRHINLSEAEIDLLRRITEGLALIADVSRADVTLWIKDGDAGLVVAQAMPASIATLYRQPWVGRRYPLAEDPLLAAGLERGRRGQRQHDLLEMGTPVVQQVFPVILNRRPIPAVIQIETNLIAWERHKRRHKSFQRAVAWLQQMVLRGHVRGAAGLSRFSEWDGIFFVDETYHIRYLSGIANNLYRRLGYLDDLHGKHIGDLQTRDEVLIRQAFATRACQEHRVQEGGRHWTRKVVPIWRYPPRWWPLSRQEHSTLPLRGALVMVHDETEAVRKAQELKVLATMIKEVHHRVKNNLQTVASILRMQARRMDGSEARQHLQEAVNRILAVAIIHEFLSRNEDQAINIRDVCQRIATQTQRAVLHPGQQIALRVDGPAIYLSSQQATACALVANELVLNALEHAYHGREQGTIALKLADQGDRVRLVVVDDGVGLPDGFDLAGANSLGLSIVRTLVEGDLKGRFELESAQPGTRAVVTFPKGKPEQHGDASGPG